MPTSDGKNCERAMTGEGVESQIPTGAKGPLSFAEKNFGWANIFFACCFFSGGSIYPQ